MKIVWSPFTRRGFCLFWPIAKPREVLVGRRGGKRKQAGSRVIRGERVAFVSGRLISSALLTSLLHGLHVMQVKMWRTVVGETDVWLKCCASLNVVGSVGHVWSDESVDTRLHKHTCTYCDMFILHKMMKFCWIIK